MHRSHSFSSLKFSGQKDESMLTDLFYRFADTGGLTFEQLYQVVLQLQPSATRLDEMKLKTFLKRYMLSGTMNLGTFIETCLKTDLFFLLEAGLLLLSRVFQTKQLPPNIVKSVSFRLLDPHEILFTEDERVDYYTMLLYGKLRYYRDSEGVLQVLDEKTTANSIGETLLFMTGGYPYSCCAADEETAVLTVPLNVVKEWCANEKGFFLKVVGAVLRHAKYLDHLTLYHDLFGRSESDAYEVSVPPTLRTPGSLRTPREKHNSGKHEQVDLIRASTTTTTTTSTSNNNLPFPSLSDSRTTTPTTAADLPTTSFTNSIPSLPIPTTVRNAQNPPTLLSTNSQPNVTTTITTTAGSTAIPTSAVSLSAPTMNNTTTTTNVPTINNLTNSTTTPTPTPTISTANSTTTIPATTATINNIPQMITSPDTSRNVTPTPTVNESTIFPEERAQNMLSPGAKIKKSAPDFAVAPPTKPSPAPTSLNTSTQTKNGGVISDISDWRLVDILHLNWDASSLTDKDLSILSSHVTKMNQKAGTYLSAGLDSAYIVLNGRVDFVQETGNFTDTVGFRTTGQPIGFTSVLCGLPILPRAYCPVATTVLRFPKVAFDYLADFCRDFLRSIVERRISFSFQKIKELKFEYRFSRLPTNNVLVSEGETPKGLYVILTGEVLETHAAAPEFRNYRGPGELVGVRAVISGKPYSATFKAIRNSEVVLFQLTKQQLAKLIATRPKLLERILARRNRPTPFHTGVNITIMLNPNIDSKEFVNRFFKQIYNLSNRSIILTKETILEHFELDAEHFHDISDLIPLHFYTNDLGLRYDFIIFLADSTAPRWTQQVIQQSDCVLLLEHVDVPPVKSLFDVPFRKILAQTTTNIHMVVLYDKVFAPHSEFTLEQRMPRDRNIKQVHHVVLSNKADMARLARLVTDRAIAVVFGGGSARGLCHVGVLQALKEARIPVDMVAGASAGAIVAGMAAKEYNLRDMARIFSRAFYLSSWIFDFTPPFLSFLTGRRVNQTLGNVFGEKTKIEDLRVPMVCVSTNLSTRSQYVHTKGVLWESVRASMTLPPVLPPVRCEEGLLVDGGFLNNIPVDLCATRGAGFVIGISVTPMDRRLEDQFPDNYQQYLGGWSIMRDRYLYGSKRTGMSLMQIISELNFLVNSNRNPDKGANIFISVPHMEGFSTFISKEDVPFLITTGYREAKSVLNKFKEEQPEIWKKITIAEQEGPNEPITTVSDLIQANANDWAYVDFAWGIIFYTSVVAMMGTGYLWLKHRK